MIILLVDDDERRHESAETYLGKPPHTLLHAYNIEETLAIFNCCEDADDKIGLLLLDYNLEDHIWENGKKIDRNGLMITDEILKLDPKKWPARVISHSIISFGGGVDIARKFREAGIIQSVYRPYHNSLMSNLVEELRPQ